MLVFKDQLFNKNDAKKLVEEQEIFLVDKFELERNESKSGIGEYYHTFTLQISEHDKQNATDKIKNSTDFKKLGEPIVDIQYGGVDTFNKNKLVQNYETKDSYIREYFESNDKGYAPTYRKITIDKSANKLTFEDID